MPAPSTYGDVLMRLDTLCERYGFGPKHEVRLRAFGNLGYLMAEKMPVDVVWNRLTEFVLKHTDGPPLPE